jgi:hypothetical protein
VSARWIRVPPERRHDVTAALVAGALAVGVGATAFWLTRLFLAREPLPREGAERTAPRSADASGGTA